MPDLFHSGKMNDEGATQNHARAMQVYDAISEVCGTGRAMAGAGLWQNYGRGRGWGWETWALTLTKTLGGFRGPT